MIAPPPFNPTSFAAQLAAKKRSSWSRPQPPTQAKIKIAAELCAVPESCIQSALDQNLLYFTTSREGIQAWVVTDPTRNAAVAYRLDGQPWELVSLRTRRPISGPHRVLPASISGWPVGLPQSAQAPAIAIVELGVDFICALHLNWCAAREHVIAPVALLSHVPIAEQALERFHDKHICLFPHTDTPQEVHELWSDQLRSAGALEVEEYSFAGLVNPDGSSAQNLRDFLHLDVDQWEIHRDEIENAMHFGPISKPRTFSPQAINQGVEHGGPF
jgi:hypothetical protein